MITQTVAATLGQAVFGYIVMAIIACICAVIIRLIVLVLAQTQKRAPIVAPPLTVSVKPAADDPAAVAAVIAAAVHSALGGHRLVSFTEAMPQPGWAHEIRSRHHTSHTPHR